MAEEITAMWNNDGGLSSRLVPPIESDVITGPQTVRELRGSAKKISAMGEQVRGSTTNDWRTETGAPILTRLVAPRGAGDSIGFNQPGYKGQGDHGFDRIQSAWAQI